MQSYYPFQAIKLHTFEDRLEQLLCLVRLQRVSLLREGGKRVVMHAISIVITPLFYPSFTSYFLFLSFFIFNFLFRLPSLLLLFSLWVLFLFICYIKLMRFLSFTLVSHQTLFFATYTYQVKRVSTAHLTTYSIFGKIPFAVNTSLSSRIVIPHVPLRLFPLACIIWSQPACYWLWQRCLTNHLPKEVLSTKPHPL